jgi:hypothetical protein
MPLGQIIAAGLPDPDDGQVPLRCPLALSLVLGGGCEFRVGGDEQAQPLRLTFGEPVNQVVQVVVVMSRWQDLGTSSWPGVNRDDRAGVPSTGGADG